MSRNKFKERTFFFVFTKILTIILALACKEVKAKIFFRNFIANSKNESYTQTCFFSELTTLTLLIFVVILQNSQASVIADMQACLKDRGINLDKNFVRNGVNFRDPTYTYVELNFQRNVATARKSPLAYIVVESIAEIQDTVKCGIEHDISIVARNGGHGYLDDSYGINNNTVVVIMSQLNQIRVHSGEMSASIGAGALLGRVIYQLFSQGYVMPYGDAASVGITGYTLGGGHSRLSTLYGMGSDAAIEFQMVDARGEFLVINDHSNSDLYWALRGGGGGNFGIVTQIKFKLYPIPKKVVIAEAEFNFQQPQFSDSFDKWQISLPSNPKSVQCTYAIDDRKIGVTYLDFQSEDDAKNIGVKRLENIISSFSNTSKPVYLKAISFEEHLVKNTIAVRGNGFIVSDIPKFTRVSDLEQVSHYGKAVPRFMDASNPIPGISEYFKAKSAFVSKMLTRNEITQLYDLLSQITTESITFEGFGGAINEVPSDATAFVHRNSLYLFEIFSVRKTQLENGAQAKISRVFKETEQLLGHKHSFQNYLDPDLPDYLSRYYGSNLEKLIQVKAKYDPKNFFRGKQSIPVSGGEGLSQRCYEKLSLVALVLMLVVKLF